MKSAVTCSDLFCSAFLTVISSGTVYYRHNGFISVKAKRNELRQRKIWSIALFYNLAVERSACVRSQQGGTNKLVVPQPIKAHWQVFFASDVAIIFF